jgi:undecaprenyl-diphosphatase
MSRKHKGMFDWNWLDALVSGIGQALLVIPGCGWSTGLLSAGRFRSYNREAIAKYGFFAAAPLLAASAVRHLREVNWHDAMPQADLSWFSFIIAIIITTLAGLLAIGGFMKHIQRKGFGQYIIYRLLLAGGVLVVYWIRSRN